MSTKKFVRYLIGALAVSISIVAMPAMAASATDAPAANTIVMKDFDFSPMSLTVKAGSSVTWENLDGEPHTVTSVDGLFRSGALDQNDSYTFKFDKPGTYHYTCSIHPKMVGTVVVQ